MTQLPEKLLPTFDIESVGWVNPIAVGFFDGVDYHEFIRNREDQDVIWEFLCYLRNNYPGYKLYAHCASKYDNKFILSSLCKHGEIVLLEAGLARLRWKATNIYFEDSYLLVPMPLKEMNKIFGGHEKGEWPHEKNLKPWEMGENLITFRTYLKNDCISLAQSLYGVCEALGGTFGVTPSISLSTTAAKVFDKCFYSLDDINPNEEYEEFIRKTIYGGRNEVYKRYGENINSYDVKSMYVSCYDVPVPVGKMRWIKGDIDKGTIAEAIVKVPKDWYIGPLPVRRRGQLIFPVGELPLDWWDMRELRNAVNLGCDISIRRQLHCEEEPVVEEFGRFVGKLRGDQRDYFWKIFGISLSGKLGQDRWRDSIKHVDSIKDMKGFFPIDVEETYFQTKEYLGGRAPYVRPLVAMRIRSEARTRHLRLLLEAKKQGEIFYGDTDSVFTTAIVETGEGTGKVQFLGKIERGYFIRQKLYAIIQKGVLRQASAGYSDLKLSEEDFKMLLEGKTIRIDEEYLSHYKGVIKDKEVELLNRVRKLRGSGGDSRVPEGNDTKPICLP